MKRHHDGSAISFTDLPKFEPNDARLFKSVLPDKYRLTVTKLVDISKPVARPIDDVDEPEDDETAQAAWMNKSNARMMQLDLKDSNNTTIKAIETERIEMLSTVKPHWTITIKGPVDVRCNNIMLEKRHVINVEPMVVEVIDIDL